MCAEVSRKWRIFTPDQEEKGKMTKEGSYLTKSLVLVGCGLVLAK